MDSERWKQVDDTMQSALEAAARPDRLPLPYCRKLGVGGTGVVYKAEHTRLQRFVALKFLSDEFARHPQALSRYKPGIATKCHSILRLSYGGGPAGDIFEARSAYDLSAGRVAIGLWLGLDRHVVRGPAAISRLPQHGAV